MAKRGINEILQESRAAYAAGDREKGARLHKEAFLCVGKKRPPVSGAAKQRRAYFARMKW